MLVCHSYTSPPQHCMVDAVPSPSHNTLPKTWLTDQLCGREMKRCQTYSIPSYSPDWWVGQRCCQQSCVFRDRKSGCRTHCWCPNSYCHCYCQLVRKNTRNPDFGPLRCFWFLPMFLLSKLAVRVGVGSVLRSWTYYRTVKVVVLFALWEINL